MKTTTSEKKEKKGEKADGKDMRQGSDIENFYRFVNANNLRREAYIMLSHVVNALKGKSKKRKTKKVIH